MRALLFLLPLVFCASAYEVILGNFITTYFPSAPNTNLLPKIDFYFNDVLVSTGGVAYGPDQMQTVTVVPVNGSIDGLWTIKATDATLYQWDSTLVANAYFQFYSVGATTYNLWVSRSTDTQDAVLTPRFNLVFFPDFQGDGTNCAGITGVDTSTGVLIVNVGTGQGNNQGFGNVNFNTDGVNQNVQPGNAQFESMRIYANTKQNTGLNINAAGRRWVQNFPSHLWREVHVVCLRRP